MSEIIVGLDGSPRGEDALAFAGQIAEATGASLTLASAFPYEDRPSRAAVATYYQYMRQDTVAMLERARATVEGVDVEIRALPDHSPARALHLLAEDTHASLIVIGSSHHSRMGRVLIGGTAERLVHGAPCSVAVVPNGYASGEHGPIRTIGVGCDDSEESRTAAIAAAEAARRLDADLRVIRVFDAASVGPPALMTGPGYHGAVFRDVENRFREHHEQFVASLPDNIRTESVFIAGSPARDLTAQSEGLDLMVLGSRGYGPHRAVLVGGVSHAVVRDAACPVIVLTRGARPSLGVLFASTAQATVS